MPYKDHKTQIAYMKQWQKDNKEKYSEYNKQRKKRWYTENKKRFLACLNRWREKNPNYNKEYNQKYLIANRGKINAYNRQWTKTERGKMVKQRGNIARRAKERNIINILTLQEWLNILEKYNHRCAYCDIEFDCENLPTKDHLIPISRGGHNIKENVVPACQSCNSRKSNKMISVMKGS